VRSGDRKAGALTAVKVPTVTHHARHYAAMDAAPSALLEHDTDELAEAFFSRPPHTSDPVIEEWRLRPMRAIERLAMHVTLATLTCSVLCALALFLFRDVAVFPSAVSAQRDAVATPLAPVTMTAAIRSEHSTNSPSAGTTPVSPKQIATEVSYWNQIRRV